MPDVGSWRLKKLWIGRLGLRRRGMLPDMKRRWHSWRLMRREVPGCRWNLSWPESSVPLLLQKVFGRRRSLNLTLFNKPWLPRGKLSDGGGGELSSNR